MPVSPAKKLEAVVSDKSIRHRKTQGSESQKKRKKLCNLSNQYRGEIKDSKRIKTVKSIESDSVKSSEGKPVNVIIGRYTEGSKKEKTSIKAHDRHFKPKKSESSRER